MLIEISGDETGSMTLARKDEVDAAYREQNKRWDWLCARVRCAFTLYVHGPELRVCVICGKPNPKWLKIRAAMQQPSLF